MSAEFPKYEKQTVGRPLFPESVKVEKVNSFLRNLVEWLETQPEEIQVRYAKVAQMSQGLTEGKRSARSRKLENFKKAYAQALSPKQLVEEVESEVSGEYDPQDAYEAGRVPTKKGWEVFDVEKVKAETERRREVEKLTTIPIIPRKEKVSPAIEPEAQTESVAEPLVLSDDLRADVGNQFNEKDVTVEYGEKSRRLDVLEKYINGVQKELDALREKLKENDPKWREKGSVYNSFSGAFRKLKNRVEKVRANKDADSEELKHLKAEFDDKFSELRAAVANFGDGAVAPFDLSGFEVSTAGDDSAIRPPKLFLTDSDRVLEDTATEVIDSSDNGVLQPGDSGKAEINGEIKTVKIIGINSDDTLSVSFVEDLAAGEQAKRFVVDADKFQIHNYEIRRKLKQELRLKEDELAKMYKTRSYRWVGKWLGKDKQAIEELNQAKSAFNQKLRPALSARAESQKSAANEYLASKGDTEAIRRQKLIDTHYNAWFIKRNVIDDAVWRNEISKGALTPTQEKLLKKLQAIGKFSKKRKWLIRAGILTAAGTIAAGGAVMAGAALASAVAMGAGASALTGGRMMAALGAAGLAGSSVFTAMSGRVFANEDRLGAFDKNIRTEVFDKNISELDDMALEAMQEEYRQSIADVDKSKSQRSKATAAAALGTGFAVGGGYEAVTEVLAPGIPPDAPANPLESNPEGISSQADSFANVDRHSSDLMSPQPSENGVEPALNKPPEISESVLPAAIEPAEISALTDISKENRDFGTYSSEDNVIDVNQSIDPIIQEAIIETEPIPGDHEATSKVVEMLPNPAQMIEVPKDSTPSEAFWSAYKAGELKGLPEDMGRKEFLNKMWDAFHAFDGNEKIVMERMGMDRPDVDFIKAGDSFNVTPLIEHMNGKTIKEIEVGQYDASETLRKEETDRATTPETSPRPAERPANLDTLDSVSFEAKELALENSLSPRTRPGQVPVVSSMNSSAESISTLDSLSNEQVVARLEQKGIGDVTRVIRSEDNHLYGLLFEGPVDLRQIHESFLSSGVVKNNIASGELVNVDRLTFIQNEYKQSIIADLLDGNRVEILLGENGEYQILESKTPQNVRTTEFTAPETSLEPKVRPEDLDTSNATINSEDAAVAESLRPIARPEGVDVYRDLNEKFSSIISEAGLNPGQVEKIRVEYFDRVTLEKIPVEKQEAFLEMLITRTEIEERMEAIPVFGEKVPVAEVLAQTNEWSNYDYVSQKDESFSDDVREYLDLIRAMQKQGLLIDGESLQTSLEQGIQNGRIRVTDSDVFLMKPGTLLSSGSELAVRSLRK